MIHLSYPTTTAYGVTGHAHPVASIRVPTYWPATGSYRLRSSILTVTRAGFTGLRTI